MSDLLRDFIPVIASLGVDVVSIAVYLVYGLIADIGGDPTAFVVLSLPYLAVAGWVFLGRPPAPPSG